MLFSKPKWLCHEPDSNLNWLKFYILLTNFTEIKGTHLYSISYHPKEPKLATASSGNFSTKIM